MKAKGVTRKSNVVKMATVNVAEAGTDNEIAKMARQLYESVMNNLKQVGNKFFVCIDRELLFADPRFQRLNKAGGHKVSQLALKWNPNKCDPIKVSPHDDECRFSIIDGLHRFLAAEIVGEKKLVCEVILDLPKEPEARLKAEAFLFATQNDEVDTLTPTEKHNANLILGIPEYLAVENVSNKYGVAIRRGLGGKNKAGTLSCYSTALRIAKVNGEELLDNVFKVICESRWNLNTHGFTDKTLKAISDILKLHPEHTEEIIEEMVKFFKPITPQNFMAQSLSAYPERTRVEPYTLYLEDVLCDIIGMDRLYLADKGIVRNKTSIVKAS